MPVRTEKEIRERIKELERILNFEKLAGLRQRSITIKNWHKALKWVLEEE